jgi:PII-like signaling protein
VIEDCTKLTVYFGERDRAGDRFLADALVDCFERRRVPASVLTRGIEGFGRKHGLSSQRLLSLSEDLPLVAAAVERADRVDALADEVGALCEAGLITLERARMVSGRLADAELSAEPTKLTLWLGRYERSGRRPAFVAAVDALRDAGVDGASVILGVDGTRAGVRRRARFFHPNDAVPLMVLAVGPGEAMASALERIDALVEDPLALIERVRVCKRAGRRLADPAGHAGPGQWQKLMVYAPENTQAGGHALHVELIRRLRAAGADGATALRGLWGYQGTMRPQGDRLLSIRRRVPVVTTVIDAPDRAEQWFAIADDVTAETGVVTSELVPTRRV